MDERIVKNATWIIVCKSVQVIISMIIGMMVARYLGPENYGLLSYATSVSAFMLPIMQLGLGKTLIQEFIEKPEREGEILGTALVMNLVSSCICITIIYVFIILANPGEKETIMICSLYSISLIFQATEMINYWFQSKLLSKFSSIASLAAYTVVSLYKLFLLVINSRVVFFALSDVINYFIVSIVLFIIYHKKSNDKICFSLDLVKILLSRSRYYIVSSMIATIFAQTDRIMLKLMMGDAETGYYSAAITSISVTGFIFVAIIDSMRPVILEAKVEREKEYEDKLIVLYSIITYLSLAQSIVMTLLAKPIIIILFGYQYLNSICVVRIAVWYVTFSYYGTIRNIWILAESKQVFLWKINISGAILNVAINYALIPLLGAVGAAIASLMTQLFMNVVVNYLIKPIRYNNTLMLKGLNPRPIIDFTKHYWKKLRKRS